MKSALYSPLLKHGDMVTVLSTGWWAESDILQKGADFLAEKLGLIVNIPAQNALRNGQLAGTREEVLAAFHEAVTDPAVKGIFFARGGYGNVRLLSGIDYDLVRQNPKIYAGFSDATALLSAISAQTGLVTYHAPMVKSWADGTFSATAEEEAVTALKAAVMEEEGALNASQKSPHALLTSARTPSLKFLQKGTAEGLLWGGNFTVLNELVGTPYLFPQQAENIILFLEDIGEEINDIDKYFWHLKNAGLLGRIKGVVLGDMTKLKDNNPPHAFGRTVEEIAESHIAGPILGGAPFGHEGRLHTLPLGAPVRLTVTEQDGSLEALPL